MISFVGQNPYSNLNKSLMEAINRNPIKNDQVRVPTTTVEQTDDIRTDGQADNNRSSANIYLLAGPLLI